MVPRNYGYEFEDGKLIITDVTTEGEPFSYPLGYGSINSFEVRNGLFTFCKPPEGPFRDCENGTSSFLYYTTDSVSAELGLENVMTEMGPNDTLAIYNYRYLFN